MSLNINGTGGGGININGTSTSGGSTVVVDTFPPTSSSSSAAASVNCVRQLYSAIGTGGTVVVDTSPPQSASSTATAVHSARVSYITYTLANAAMAAASSATTTAGNALTTSTLATSTNIANSAGTIVTVGLSGQSMVLQGVTNPICLQVAFSDETTAITSTNMANIRAPFAFNVRNTALPLFMLYSLGTAGTTTFDVLKNGGTIYATKPTITYAAAPLNSQYTSTANAGALLGGASVIAFTQFDLITVRVVTSGTGQLGAKCIITSS